MEKGDRKVVASTVGMRRGGSRGGSCNFLLSDIIES